MERRGKANFTFNENTMRINSLFGTYLKLVYKAFFRILVQEFMTLFFECLAALLFNFYAIMLGKNTNKECFIVSRSRAKAIFVCQRR